MCAYGSGVTIVLSNATRRLSGRRWVSGVIVIVRAALLALSVHHHGEHSFRYRHHAARRLVALKHPLEARHVFLRRIAARLKQTAAAIIAAASDGAVVFVCARLKACRVAARWTFYRRRLIAVVFSGSVTKQTSARIQGERACRDACSLWIVSAAAVA